MNEQTVSWLEWAGGVAVGWTALGTLTAVLWGLWSRQR